MIQLVKVASRDEGQLKAHQLLTETVNQNTLLVLSGGRSVDYQKMIVAHIDVRPGDVCMADERYGVPFNENSNELLVKNSGLLEYLAAKKIPFHKVLSGKMIGQTEKDYDLKIRELFAKYKDKVGVMGVGVNVHTGGIFPHSKALKSPAYVVSEMVDDIFPERVTLTLRALAEMTSFIVMMFGEEKKEALKTMLDVNQNDIQRYPAVFFRRCRAIAHVVTDISSNF